MQNSIMMFLAPLALFASCQKKEYSAKMPEKPNIIYILADDLGYGDLGCYGQQKFETPNIDRLAAEGMRFTRHYAGSAVCAPSRSSLMTGMDTGHTPIRRNRAVRPVEGQMPLPAGTFTIPRMMKDAGYTTGAFGKWALGFIENEGHPMKHGFDKFYGFYCQDLAHNYFPEYLWENEKKIVLTGNTGDQFKNYAPELIHQQALGFIEENHDKTFFLYYASQIPHAEMLVPEKYLAKYRGKYPPEKPFVGIKPGDEGFRKGSGYGYQAEPRAAFAAMINVLDDQVGEIIYKLKELGIEKNTLVIFTSDNGPHNEGGADPEYFNSNGPLRGIKRDLYEGGIRVPMIAWWPGTIKSGSTTNHVSAFWDVIPTLAELAGAEVPTDIQGISFAPALTGKTQQKHDYLYWELHERGGRQAIIKKEWKLVLYNVLKPNELTFELYDLEKDEGEKNNLAGEFPNVLKELMDQLETVRKPSELFPFIEKLSTGK